MKHIFFLSLIILFGPSIAMGADNFYCDCQTGADGACVAGSDSNSGSSPDAPRQSFANAQSIFSSLAAGDSIQFCRGGSFSVGSGVRWSNTSCTEESPCVVTDYEPNWAQSELARPIITQPNSARVFDMDRSGQEGFTFSNMDLRCTGCSTSGSSVGVFLYQSKAGVILENLRIEGFRIGVQAAPDTGSIDRLTLRGLEIVHSERQGFLGAANELIIEDSYFEDNGEGTIYDHNIYVSGGDNIIIRGNELYRSSLDSNGACMGVPLVVHGTVNTMLIEGNTIREDVGLATPYCWGIGVDTGYSASEYFRDVTIRGNTIINVGNVGIGVTSCDNCLIENNTILHQQEFGITAIAAPNKSRRDNDGPLDEVTVRNNSIYIASSGTGINIGTEGTNHTLVSNAIHYSGTGNFNCINVGLSPSAYRAIDHNTCFFPNSSSVEWEDGSGTSPTPLGAWQGIHGMGLNSQNQNPGFESPELPQVNFDLRSDAAGRNSGSVTLSAPKDFRGKNRDARPDAGAFEFGVFNPPGSTILSVE